MVQISGKYELVKNEKLYEHLLARSVPEEQTKKMQEQKSTIIIVLNKEIVEKFSENISTKSTAVLNGNVLTVTSKGDGKFSTDGKRIFTFSDSELVITVEGDSDKIPVAKRFYKKL